MYVVAVGGQAEIRVEERALTVKRAVSGATIAAVFFVPGIATAALLGTNAVFAISFVVRPIGGLVWGHYGDKIGRQRVLAITIIIMTLATFAIGFLPGHATIGIAALLLLLVCRLVQGFSASGEYAGASSFIAEYAGAATHEDRQERSRSG